MRDSGHIDIITDYGEYSEQEIRMIEGVKRAVRFAHSHRRPMTNAELRENNKYEITSLKSTNTNETGKGPFFLLITGEEWNHDDDRWLGIYVDKKDAREAYDRALSWWDEEQKHERLFSSQRVAMFEFILDRFREVERKKLD